MSIRVIVAVLCLSCSISRGFGQSAEIDPKVREKIEKAIKGYDEAKKKELAEMVKRMKAKEDRYRERSKKLPKGVSQEQHAMELEKMEQKRNALIKSGTLPDDLGDIEDVFKFQEKLHLARKPIVNAFESAIQEATSNRNTTASKALLKWKAEWDETLPGREQFANGTVWEGQRLQGPRQDSFSVRLDIKGVIGNKFDGLMEQNNNFKNHPVFKIEGTLDGAKVSFKTTETTRGRPQFYNHEGYLTGKRIVGKIAGVDVNKVPVSGHFQLLLK